MLDFTIAPASLHRLRHRLDAAGEGVAADLLHQAGYASGEALHERWRNHLAERTGLLEAGWMDVRWFGPLLDELCVGLGWGSIAATPLGDRAMLLEAGDWAEAEPGAGAQPGCHFTCGALAAFLTALAGSPLAVLEVECRTAGQEACRFLAASPATLSEVHDLLAAGRRWHDAFLSSELPA
jgi:hypothetical protein